MLPPPSAPVSIPTHMAGFALARFSIRLSLSPQFLLLAPFPPSSSGFLQSMPVGDLGFVGDCLPDRFGSVKMHAVNKNGPKWWERNASPNMIDVHSTEDFLNALNQAEDKLVMVEFYGTWCASCKALFPKLCRTVAAHSEILFLKVNFDENKPMCKRLNVKVLPYFHFYRGADGLLEAFSCSLPKFQKIKDAIATHTTARCSIGPPAGVGDLNFLEASMPEDMPAESSPA